MVKRKELGFLIIYVFHFCARKRHLKLLRTNLWQSMRFYSSYIGTLESGTSKSRICRQTDKYVERSADNTACVTLLSAPHFGPYHITERRYVGFRLALRLSMRIRLSDCPSWDFLSFAPVDENVLTSMKTRNKQLWADFDEKMERFDSWNLWVFYWILKRLILEVVPVWR